MGLQEYTKQTTIHQSGTPVNSVEIVLKGSVSANVKGETITFSGGYIIGLAEKEGETYRYTYEAAEDAVLYSYPLQGQETVDKVIHVNQKIAPSMASSSVHQAEAFYEAYLAQLHKAKSLYNQIGKDFEDYKKQAPALGLTVESFPELARISSPGESGVDPWQVNFLKMYFNYDDKFKSEIYTLGPDMCSGVVYTVGKFIRYVSDLTEELSKYMEELREQTKDFRLAYDGVKAKAKQLENQKAAAVAQYSGQMPDMSGATESILDFAGLMGADREKFQELMRKYKSYNDRSDVSDDMRKLRKEMTLFFYKIYEGAFLQSLKVPQIPVEVMMFFMTGFIDMEIAGESNTEQIFEYVSTYMPDPQGKFFTAYEWLKKIYNKEVDPSRDEFDMDYPAYLRDCRNNGEIDEEEEQRRLVDGTLRFKFEVKNLFTLGNRMTFGRPMSFFPFFDSCNAMLPLEKCFVSYDRLHEELDWIRSLDYQCFFREEVYSNPEAGINQMMVHREFLPYIILMPNVGSRSMMWQEIEGKKRSSCARMLMPIFNMTDLQDAVAQMCGEFRWEMCKTEQGVHWNDLSDPSLTAEFSDYLQYYRKNQNLSPDVRERVKKSLQKAGNNFRRVFVADYVTYLMFEAKGALRLNKVSREIIFTYCSFAQETCQALEANPQYANLIARKSNKLRQKLSPMAALLKRYEAKGEEPPKELLDEIAYLKR